tara:strand:+ start:202 stop:696 length:495 start_codon:yes stop_codon:yes gene_type:complete
MKKALVYGANSEIAKKLIETLKEGNAYWVRGVDIEDSDNESLDEFIVADLTKESSVMTTMFSDTTPFDEVYQFVGTKKGKTADEVTTTTLVNINTLNYARRYMVGKIISLSANNKFIENLYSLFDKDKKVKSYICKISNKTKDEDILSTIKKENKKSFKKLGKL